jgi:hypothetical protein
MSVAEQILGSGEPQPQATPEQTTQEPQQQGGAPNFDLIAKMERRLKQREEEFKTKEQKLAEYEAKLKEYEGFDENPLPTLFKKGFDIEKINKLAMETLGDDDLDPIARRFKQIEEAMGKKDQEFESKMQQMIAAKEKEFQDKEQQYQIESFKRDLKSHVTAKKDEYEFVNTHPDGMELVYDVIFTDLQRKQAAGGQVEPMSYDDAATKVEEYLYNEAQKYLSLNKVKSKFVEKKEDWASLLKSEEPKTITQQMAPKSAIHPAELSEQERMKLAIEGLKTGKWNV